MNENALLISIVLPCRNERDHIEACLRSIFVQDPPPGGFEILVADGMSTDGTRDILLRLTKHDSRMRVIDNPSGIVACGLNAAIREAQGMVIMRMDAHTDFATDYIRQCLNVLRETAADNVGGPARTKSTSVLQSAICAAYHSPFAVGGAKFHDVNYEGYVDTVTYGCWPREIFDRIGLFDEELVRNQDDEFNLRLTRAGGKIWQSPRIKSWYSPRGSLRALFQQYMQYGYWKVRVIQKHRLPASMRHLVPGCFVLSLIMLSLASLFWTPAIWGLLGLTAIYLTCNLTASLLTAAKSRWSLFPVLPFIFASYHFGYGYGFTRGVCDFVILRRGPNRAFTHLTRTTSAANSSYL